MTANGVFHVVCRECRTESVVRSRADAKNLVDEHVSTLGHRAEFAQVE
jgi:hypothetical protein